MKERSSSFPLSLQHSHHMTMLPISFMLEMKMVTYFNFLLETLFWRLKQYFHIIQLLSHQFLHILEMVLVALFKGTNISKIWFSHPVLTGLYAYGCLLLHQTQFSSYHVLLPMLFVQNGILLILSCSLL